MEKDYILPNDCYRLIRAVQNSITTYMQHCKSMIYFCSSGVINNADAIPKLQSEIDRCSQGWTRLEQIYSDLDKHEEIQSLAKEAHHTASAISLHSSQLERASDKDTTYLPRRSDLEAALNDDYSRLTSLQQLLTPLCSPIYQEVLLLWEQFPLGHDNP